jgi:hypothetical protein
MPWENDGKKLMMQWENDGISWHDDGEANQICSLPPNIKHPLNETIVFCWEIPHSIGTIYGVFNIRVMGLEMPWENDGILFII